MDIEISTFIVASATLLVAIISIYIGYYSFRYQHDSLIISQLNSKSNEINAILIKNRYQLTETDTYEMTNIIASTIQAIQFLDYHAKDKKIINLLYQRQDFIDQFYIMLNTRVMLFFGDDYANSLRMVKQIHPDSPKDCDTVVKQFNDCVENLKVSVERFRGKVK